MPPVLAPLRHGPFARYMGGEAISMVGTWMQSFTQGWLLATLTSSAWVLGAINFTAGIPMLLLTLVGGSAADRYDKRIFIQSALIAQGLCAAAIGYLIASQQIVIWHIFVAAFVVGISTAFEVPAVSAFVPELVPREQMANALAIDRSVFHATRLLGPALGGWLISRYGFAQVYFANAVTYLPLILAVLSVPRRPRGSAAEEELRRGSMGAGIAYVRADEPTRAMLLLVASGTVCVSPFIVILMPIYAQRTLGLPPDLGGTLMAVTGIGSLIGSLGVLAIRPGFRATALKFGATFVVCGLAGLSSARSFGWAVASLIPLLIGLSTCFSVANIVVQERAPDALRGRISAVFSLSFFGLIPFSGLLVSSLIDAFGMRTMLAAGSVGYGLAATFVLFRRNALASAPLPPAETIAAVAEDTALS